VATPSRTLRRPPDSQFTIRSHPACLAGHFHRRQRVTEYDKAAAIGIKTKAEWKVIGAGSRVKTPRIKVNIARNQATDIEPQIHLGHRSITEFQKRLQTSSELFSFLMRTKSRTSGTHNAAAANHAAVKNERGTSCE
jgi:hypothetical protein